GTNARSSRSPTSHARTVPNSSRSRRRCRSARTSGRCPSALRTKHSGGCATAMLKGRWCWCPELFGARSRLHPDIVSLAPLLFRAHSRRERHPQRVGEIAHLELAHHVGAVDLHRARADAKIVGNRLVRVAAGKPFEHFLLTLGQLANFGSRPVL